MYDHNTSTHALSSRAWSLRWQRFAQSRWHRALALLAALCVTHGAWAHHRDAPAADATNKALPLAKAQHPQGSGVTGVLNINKANAEQWQRFPGIGPSTARKILAHREHKSFRSVQQLQEVKGIGPAFLKRFGPHLKISGPTTLERLRPSKQAKRSKGKGKAR